VGVREGKRRERGRKEGRGGGRGVKNKGGVGVENVEERVREGQWGA